MCETEKRFCCWIKCRILKGFCRIFYAFFGTLNAFGCFYISVKLFGGVQKSPLFFSEYDYSYINSDWVRFIFCFDLLCHYAFLSLFSSIYVLPSKLGYIQNNSNVRQLFINSHNVSHVFLYIIALTSESSSFYPQYFEHSQQEFQEKEWSTVSSSSNFLSTNYLRTITYYTCSHSIIRSPQFHISMNSPHLLSCELLFTRRNA